MDASKTKLTLMVRIQTPRENITGTRGGFKTYSTVKPKIVSHTDTEGKERLVIGATADVGLALSGNANSRHGSQRSLSEDRQRHLIGLFLQYTLL